MNLNKVLAEELLAQVEKPSRYLGTELNSVHKDRDKVDVRIALTFPDLYDIGLGNLGLHILYAILNKMDGVWAERLYAPGLDMEKLLRARKLPLFALESKDSMESFDGVGFTLQSELTYTNILNIIDLIGLPLRTRDRSPNAPLLFCGGPAVFNPEPLVPFMDFFVIGDGESAVVDIANVFKYYKTRSERLEALAKLEGIYVPELYPFDVLPNGAILPAVDAPKIRKRIAPDLNSSTFPVDYIVPFTRQVHDRISLEVLRGCTQGCRFCQAGMTTRPVRERKIDNIEKLLERTLESTGYEEVSLVSLSTCDYSQVREMVQRVVQQAAPQRIGVSLPSLRLDSFAVELADMVAGIRRTGLTFAPEAASPRLRAVINKWIPDDELLQMSSEAYKLGWDHVKLYFMIGLPTERDDDVEAIADLTLKTLAIGKTFNRKARVNTGVSTFVPKPFTPFQWAPQIKPEEATRRQQILKDKFFRVHGVKFGRHPAEETFLEGLVSRADRRAGDLLELAYHLGCRFDAWDEHRNMELWYQAIDDLGYDVDYEFRERELDERLPWDHLDIFIPKKWFQDDWQRAMELKHAEDCRHSKCHRCGVIDQKRELCATMLRDAIDGKKTEQQFVRIKNPHLGERPQPGQPPKRLPEPPDAQRLLLRIGLTGTARFLSHLETNNAWLRTLRRAKVPLSYSQGFHPHPKMAFESARPVAEESLSSFMDIVLNERVDPAQLLFKLQQVCSDGFQVISVNEIPLKAPSLMSQIAGMDYLMYVPVPEDILQQRIEKILSSERLEVQRKAKKKNRRKRNSKPFRTIDVRPNIKKLWVGLPSGWQKNQGWTAMQAVLDRINERGIRPSELLSLLEVDISTCRVIRLQTRFSQPEIYHLPLTSHNASELQQQL